MKQELEKKIQEEIRRIILQQNDLYQTQKEQEEQTRSNLDALEEVTLVPRAEMEKIAERVRTIYTGRLLNPLLRLRMALLAILTLGLSGFGLTIGMYVYSAQVAAFDAKVQRTILSAQMSLQDPLWNLDYESLKSLANSIMLDKDVVSLQIADDSGEIVFAFPKESHDLLEVEAVSNQSDIHKSLPILGIKREMKIGEVSIVMTKAHMIDRLENLGIMISILVFSLVGLFGGVTWLISRKLMFSLK